MAAMTDGHVYYSFPDAQGNTVLVTLTYDSTVQDGNGNVVGGWVGTTTLPPGSSFKQSTKRDVGGETNVGVFSGTMWAVNNAGTRSSDYTMATSGFEALGLRVKETVAPVVQIITPTANQRFDTATPTFSVKVKDCGAISALSTSEDVGDSGINASSAAITLDGVTYTNYSTPSIADFFNSSEPTIDTDGGIILSVTPKNGLATSGSGATHSISVSISDNDGNATASSSVSFVCDVTAPTLSMISPDSTSVVTNQTSFTISGTTTDDESSPVVVVINVDGTEYTPTVTSGSFSSTVQLTQGASNSVTVTATNSAGLTSTWTGTIVQNNTTPVFDWVRVVNNPTTAGSTITITAFVSNGTSP